MLSQQDMHPVHCSQFYAWCSPCRKHAELSAPRPSAQVSPPPNEEPRLYGITAVGRGFLVVAGLRTQVRQPAWDGSLRAPNEETPGQTGIHRIGVALLPPQKRDSRCL